MTGLEKEMLGVMSLVEALDMADEADVDVVMINSQAEPPVVRLVDFSKFRYEQTRAKKEATKKQRESRYAPQGRDWTFTHSCLLGCAYTDILRWSIATLALTVIPVLHMIPPRTLLDSHCVSA